MRLTAFILLFALSASALEFPFRAISTNTIHLGVAGKPEWEIFAGKTPQGEKLELQFDARVNEKEGSLIIRQDDVKSEWAVELNGVKLGRLFLMEADLIHWLPVSAGTLKDGNNVLKISTKQPEDILIHGIYLSDQPMTNALRQTRLKVKVTEKRDPIPCRLTILDENGTLVPLVGYPEQTLAVRPGVVYSGTGSAELGLLPGKYSVYATRGPEYSLGKITVGLGVSGTAEFSLELTREVPTTGWIACDTHIHTLELSGHGDSTLAERMLTIAGEGIELPICTEHNQHANYSAAAEKTKTARFFTPVPGNEVTTAKGHFNIFPIAAGSPVVDYKLADWPTLMEAMRRTPDVQVVILNHPTDLHSNFRPFASTNFVSLTGRNLRGFDFSFDAMEVINSGAMQTHWMEPYNAWFGLLNHGYKVTGVGGSDSHDVSRFIVGQGRTYIQCDDSDASKIDIGQACRSVRAGRAVVSLGLFTTISVNGRSRPGDMTSGKGRVRVEVFGPGWISATNVALFANGELIQQEQIAKSAGIKPGRKASVEWQLPGRSSDYYVVAIATGPGVTAPYWAVARPYQPSSPHWDPLVIGSTNPIWIDADGDGKFTSAREYALRLIEKVHSEPKALIRRLKEYDRAVALEAFDALAERGSDLRSREFLDALEGANAGVMSAYRSLVQSIYR
jgi:hypothetical protein